MQGLPLFGGQAAAAKFEGSEHHRDEQKIAADTLDDIAQGIDFLDEVLGMLGDHPENKK